MLDYITKQDTKATIQVFAFMHVKEAVNANKKVAEESIEKESYGQLTKQVCSQAMQEEVDKYSDENEEV